MSLRGGAPSIHKDVSSVDCEITRAWWGMGRARWRVQAWLYRCAQVCKPVKMTIGEVWRQNGGEALGNEIDLRGQFRGHFASRLTHEGATYIWGPKRRAFLKDIRKSPGKDLGRHFGPTGRVRPPRARGHLPPLGHQKSEGRRGGRGAVGWHVGRGAGASPLASTPPPNRSL